MSFAQRFDSFEFYDNFVVNDQVGVVFAHYDTIKVDIDGHLLLYVKSGLAKAHGEGVFVDLFQEAVTKNVVDIVEDADDLFGEFAVFVGGHCLLDADWHDLLDFLVFLICVYHVNLRPIVFWDVRDVGR